MKNKWICSGLVTVLTACWVGPSLGASWQLLPYAGVDANYRYLPLESRYGDDHFQEHYFEPNINVGLMFHEYFGFEASYGATVKRHKNTFYSKNSEVLGFELLPNNLFEDQTHLATSQLKNYQLNFVAQYPIMENVFVFGQIGSAVNRLKLRTQPIGELSNFLNPPVEWRTSYKAVPRVALGLKALLGNGLGARAMISWQRTSRLEATTPADPVLVPPVDPGDYYTVKAKSGATVGIGLFYQYQIC